MAGDSSLGLPDAPTTPSKRARRRPSRLNAPLVITIVVLAWVLYSAFMLEEEESDLLISEEQHVREESQILKVAFLADCSLNQATKSVYAMLAKERVELVLHAGDLDYTGDVRAFDEQITEAFPYDVVYAFSKGNYENKKFGHLAGMWAKYHASQMDRLTRLNVPCSRSSKRGVSCVYKNALEFTTSSIGVNSSALDSDLADLLTAPPPNVPFSFCSWHLPIANFQVGFRAGVPWMRSKEMFDAYEFCRRRGSVVITGHEHYYLRSHTMFSFKQPKRHKRFVATVDDRTLPVAHASRKSQTTFSVVVGLGGHSVSPASLKLFASRPWLAAVHPAAEKSDPGGKRFYDINGVPKTSSERIPITRTESSKYPFGALVCELYVADANGLCRFQTIENEVIDEFVLETKGVPRKSVSG